MKKNLEIYKGIHPGKIIARELNKRGISQRSFARNIGEHSQSVNAVITGRRPLTIELSIKIERNLGYEDGFLLALQAYYNVAEYKNKEASLSVKDVPNIRKSLFWDTDFERLDWGRYRTFIIQRILERGNESEVTEIVRFYGLNTSDMDRYRSTNPYRIHSLK